MSYKCPNPDCEAIDNYVWDKDPEDDLCKCLKCETWFHACDNEIRNG